MEKLRADDAFKVEWLGWGMYFCMPPYASMVMMEGR